MRCCLYGWETPYCPAQPRLFLRPPGVSIATPQGRTEGFGGSASQGRWWSLREMSPDEALKDAIV